MQSFEFISFGDVHQAPRSEAAFQVESRLFLPNVTTQHPTTFQRVSIPSLNPCPSSKFKSMSVCWSERKQPSFKARQSFYLKSSCRMSERKQPTTFQRVSLPSLNPCPSSKFESMSVAMSEGKQPSFEARQSSYLNSSCRMSERKQPTTSQRVSLPSLSLCPSSKFKSRLLAQFFLSNVGTQATYYLPAS